MTLALLGFGMVAAFTVLIMTQRITPLVALIIVPLAVGLLAGHGTDLGPMMISGLKDLAPTAVMLLFAILFFGIMTDAGLFDPLVAAIVRLAKSDPLRITLGTAALGTLISLDGDGSTTYLIACSAMLPLYQRLGMNRLYLVCLLMLCSGVMNLTPWGGPTGRAAAALHLDMASLFLPLIPAMVAGLGLIVGMAIVFGRAERRRLGEVSLDDTRPTSDIIQLRVGPASRTRRNGVNIVLVSALMAGLILPAFGITTLPLTILMMLALALGLMVNFPRLEDQRQMIASHAGNAVSVAALIFAAGIFTGILKGTGMIEAMSQAVLATLPPGLAPHMSLVVAILSLPGTFFLSNDAFYFGMLPVLAEAGAHHGLAPAAMARAALMGQPFHLLSPLVPSTWLLVSLAGVDMGRHQRFTAGWAALLCTVMILAALAFGAFPL